MSSKYFKSGIKSSWTIDNKWRPPVGDELKNEIELIKQKKSNLSSKQRKQIQERFRGQFL